MYPWIGAGSLIFRGGLNPRRVKEFIDEYRGIRTVTVQSAFRYDNPHAEVKKAVSYLNANIGKGTVQNISDDDRKSLETIIHSFTRNYQSTLEKLTRDLEPLFLAVPRRRERRQHIGLLAYNRNIGKRTLPRAINFTAACYSLGVPPEFIGLGRSLTALSKKEVGVLRMYYRYLRHDVMEAGHYINRDNLVLLAKKNPAWRLVKEDIESTEKFFGVRFAPKTHDHLLHQNLTSQLFLQRDRPGDLNRLIAETGRLRRSLG